MAGTASGGLQVLEREVRPSRAWQWWLGGLLAAAVAVGAFVLVRRTPRLPGLAQLSASGNALPVAAAAVVLAAGLLLVTLVAVRRHLATSRLAAQQRALLDSIVGNVPDAVVVGDGRGRYRANAAAVRLFALPEESGTWDKLHAALARLDRRRSDTGLRIPAGAGVLEGALAGRAMDMDEVVRTSDGPRTLHVRGSPIPFARGPNGGLMVATDVTERIEAQAALAAARDSLAQKNAEFLQMARAIAHDLGNALMPAGMHLKILELGKTDPKRSVPVLQKSIDQMHRLVGDLSDMARLEAGAMQVATRPVRLADAVGTATTSFQPAAAERQVTLAADNAGDAVVQADPERLGQVLTNLLSNALKFTPAGGQVRIGIQGEGSAVRLAVTDTGMGLDAAQMAKLFKPFSQVHEPGSIKERGTGLGLYICKGLVERQGGQMGVASAGHGHGSTFWFTLPVVATPPQAM